MLNLPSLEVPLIANQDGSVHIRGTQVWLEQIVSDFENGAMAEEIVTRHRALTLSDVFLVLSYYLKNRKEVEGYLASRQPECHVPTRPAA